MDNKVMMKLNKRHLGFSLIELMIVVAVIVVIASIAIPSYGDYVRRGRIADATAALSDTRVKLEQFFLDNRTYVGFANCPTSTTFSSTHAVRLPQPLTHLLPLDKTQWQTLSIRLIKPIQKHP